jgi:hypothetical protein
MVPPGVRGVQGSERGPGAGVVAVQLLQKLGAPNVGEATRAVHQWLHKASSMSPAAAPAAAAGGRGAGGQGQGTGTTPGGGPMDSSSSSNSSSSSAMCCRYRADCGSAVEWVRLPQQQQQQQLGACGGGSEGHSGCHDVWMPLSKAQLQGG